MDKKELINMAIEARKNAYVPYSNFPVGAAVLMDSGKIYTGCNVESASYGATNCAERTAIFKAVSEGERKILAIAIVGDLNSITFPCGICRQVFLEFAREMKIIVATSETNYKEYTLDEIIPFSFAPSDLNDSSNGGK
ncbi:MAG: cytidine deaminase [Clostridiales bacterium]|nr:cytidine deaminase [Clostridiales bacterium]